MQTLAVSAALWPIRREHASAILELIAVARGAGGGDGAVAAWATGYRRQDFLGHNLGNGRGR
jgi:hypothetical protein